MNEGGAGFMDGVSAAITTVLGEFTDTITVGNIATLLAVALGFAIPLVLFWFGYRFLVRKGMGAFKKGKL